MVRRRGSLLRVIDPYVSACPVEEKHGSEFLVARGAEYIAFARRLQDTEVVKCFEQAIAAALHVVAYADNDEDFAYRGITPTYLGQAEA
jgi:hypothetical protein